MSQIDKAGSQYWDDNWSAAEMPALFSEDNHSLDNYVNLHIHRYFKNLFSGKKGFSIVEIGCANSIWPIYFNQYFNAQADGIDYSEVGCEKSRALLRHHNTPGTIYCADLFQPHDEICNKYDYVVSFGVVEHFEDTAHCLRSCAKLLKSGGVLITFIPNMPGVVGFIQKRVDKVVYDLHVPLTQKDLCQAHQAANLKLEKCEYFMSMNLNVVNSGSYALHKNNKRLRHALSAFSKMFWVLEKCRIKIPRNRLTSPYIVATANTLP